MTRTVRRKDRRHNQAGFTLVEVLVAITLLSLLSIALTAGLRLGIDAWTRGSAHSDELGRTLAIQGLLRELLEQAYPYFVSVDPTHGYIDFDGSGSSLVLLALTPASIGVTGRSRFKLSVNKRQEFADLIVSSQPELAVADATSSIPQKTLLAGAAAIEFRYFGGGGWNDRWTAQPALPQLIGIHVDFPRGDARVWPDLVVAPRITADVGCVYDPLTKLCRGR